MKRFMDCRVYFVCILLTALPFAAHADDSDQTDNYITYTYVDAIAGALSLSQDAGASGGGSSTSTIGMFGVSGSYGFNRLFDFGKYINVTGSAIAGSGTIANAGTLSIFTAEGGVGVHAELHPSLGDMSFFISAQELSSSTSFMGTTLSNSASLITYGFKWNILESYEWDLYGSSQGGSSSSSQQSPVGGNTINLQFTWAEHPNAAGEFFGAQYQRQSQSGSTSNSLFLVGGYRW